jgi:hypothetical protein
MKNAGRRDGAEAGAGNETPESIFSVSAPSDQAPYLLLHELSTGAPLYVRKDAIERIDAARSRRGLECAVFIRGIFEPIRVREQADDVACELGAFADRCRMCLRAMPGAGKFGGSYLSCIAEIERAWR